MLLHKKPVGKRVAVIGAGGIGFDVSEYLVVEDGHSPTSGPAGVEPANGASPILPLSAAALMRPQIAPPARQVMLLQRKAESAGQAPGQDHRLDPPRHARR